MSAQSRHRPRARALGSLLALIAAACLLAPAAASAVAPLSWTASPQSVGAAGGSAIKSISCVSASLCGAVAGGEALAGNPRSGSSWQVRAGGSYDSISCVSGSLCVAVGAGKPDVAIGAPTGSGAWSRTATIDAATITGVSCPTGSLCLAVDEAGDLWSTVNAGASWADQGTIDAGVPLRSVSCASESLCVARDSDGVLLASSAPTSAAAWHASFDSASPLTGLSCAAAACVAVTQSGSAIASGDPASSTPTWSSTLISAGELTGVSCDSSGVCVAIEAGGGAAASDNPTGLLPGWSGSAIGLSPSSVSCLPEGSCAAGGNEGKVSAGGLPAPAVSTGGPTEVTQSSATLTGTVDPEDVPLTSCRFEYGTTSSYGQSVPCASAPGPGSAPVGVSAAIAGLTSATAYRYRLKAASATGEGSGAEGAFTTGAPSNAELVHPAPYITGVPANGDRLSCNANVHTSNVTLTYSWWLGGTPIAGASKQIYQIVSADAGGHLQCEVTATNAAGSASARSAFVTVPAEGLPVSAGETTIGMGHIAAGKLQLPVSCSPQAARVCKLALRLTAVETLRGQKLLAVSARAPKIKPRERSQSVTLLARNISVPAGKQRTLSLALDATGKRLVSQARRLTAQLTVEGTVIGVLNAMLAKEQVSFVTATARAGRHAPARRRAHTASAGAIEAQSVLASTPYMGWDTYLALGPRISESIVLRQASEMISDGLQKAGYRYVWLDVGWWQGQRNAKGEITVNPTQWPHGMAWLAKTLHKAGFLVGLYTDAGKEGCGGPKQGSYGHYQQDANTFAAWGFDAVKVDFCGGGKMHLSPAQAYGAFHHALAHNSSHRPMLLSICNFREPGQVEGEPAYDESAFTSYAFGPTDGNSWRTDTDVGFPGIVGFSQVIRNLDADAAHPEAAGPGHWNDPDYLAPDQGLTNAQFKTQMSMWAMVAAPLMASDNLTTVTSASLSALQNKEVIAVDQDPAGIQGKLLSTSGEGQVWVKPLYGGERAVALLNIGSKPMRISTTAAAVGMPHASSYRLRNLWTRGTSTSAGTISAEVPGESTVMLRVSTAAQVNAAAAK